MFPQPMPLENLQTFLRLNPDGYITKVDHENDCIFFTEKNRQWVTIFDGTVVVGTWDLTGVGGDHWDERAQDQQESVGF